MRLLHNELETKALKKWNAYQLKKKKIEGSKKFLGAINSNDFKNILTVKQFLISMDG